MGCPLSRRCSPPAPSPRPPSQDDAFEGYRLAKDLLPDDACETIAIDPPALDAPASASADRVAQLASARRNVLVQLHTLPDADGTRFAFANASGGFTSVDVTHDLNTRTRVATLTPALPPAPPRPAPAPGARERPSLARPSRRSAFPRPPSRRPRPSRSSLPAGKATSPSVARSDPKVRRGLRFPAAFVSTTRPTPTETIHLDRS